MTIHQRHVKILCSFIASGLLLIANKSLAAEFIINSTTTANQMSASIASNGSNYFIMWKSTENGDETTSIYGRYMSADGQLSANEHLLASYNVSAMNIGSVTSDGTDYIMLYSNGDSTPYDADGAVGEIYRRIAAGDESSIGPELMLNTQTSNIQVVPKVAYSESSDRYLSIWQDYSPCTWTTSCQVIESEGSLVNPPGEFKTYASTYNALGDIASDGNNFLIAYSTSHPIPGDNRIFTAKGRIVSSDGSFVTSEFELSTLGLENWVDDIGFDGTNYLVTMTHVANSEGDIYGRFVSPDGTPVR